MRLLKACAALAAAVAPLGCNDPGVGLGQSALSPGVAGEFVASRFDLVRDGGEARNLLAQGAQFRLSLTSGGEFTTEFTNVDGRLVLRSGSVAAGVGNTLVFSDSPFLDDLAVAPFVFRFSRDLQSLTLVGRNDVFDLDQDGFADAGVIEMGLATSP